VPRFAGWRHALPASLEVCAIELPGRGSRFAEPALTHMDAVVDELVRMVGDCPPAPFALFGHSMGAVVAAELARRLVELGRPPIALVASACAAPHLPIRREHVLHLLPRDALIEALIHLDGLLPIARERRDFDTFMPTIRADLQCRETWRSTPHDLGIPVHVLTGADDGLVSKRTRGVARLHVDGVFDTSFRRRTFYPFGNASRTGSPGCDRPAFAGASSRRIRCAGTPCVCARSRQRDEVTHLENWQIRKAAISASGGIVVSQHYKASSIGAAVLRTAATRSMPR
jgi:surfactin synthase thioesterase subunit